MRVYEIEAIGLVFLDHGELDHVTCAVSDEWQHSHPFGEIPRQAFEDIRSAFRGHGWVEVDQPLWKDE